MVAPCWQHSICVPAESFSRYACVLQHSKGLGPPEVGGSILGGCIWLLHGDLSPRFAVDVPYKGINTFWAITNVPHTLEP